MLVGIDAVNVIAAYQSVVQACGSQWRQDGLGTYQHPVFNYVSILPNFK